MSKKKSAGLDYLDNVIRTAYGTHDKTVSSYTKYSKLGNAYGIQTGAVEGGKGMKSIVNTADSNYIRDRKTGKPFRADKVYVDIEDAKAAVQAQMDEGAKFAKSRYKVGLEIGEKIGALGARAITSAKTNEALAAGTKVGIKQGFKAGARAMFGPAAGAALIVEHLIGKGFKRAVGPGGKEFHTGGDLPYWDDRNVKNNGTKLNP